MNLPGLRAMDYSRVAFGPRRKRQRTGDTTPHKWLCADLEECDSSHFRGVDLFIMLIILPPSAANQKFSGKDLQPSKSEHVGQMAPPQCQDAAEVGVLLGDKLINPSP